MRLIAIVSLALVVSCTTEDTLHRICGNVGNGCYAVWTEDFQDPQLSSEYEATRYMELADKGLVGECELGRPTCDENKNIIDCEGAVYPTSRDECNGKDDDCNGQTDDGWYPTRSSSWNYDEPNPCVSHFGVCASAEIECISGQFICHLPSTFESEETTCDGLDNDCDIRVDELEPKGLCFDDELWKATNGECRAGLEECTYGEWRCTDQRLPSAELCDGLDNDCNGIIDDSEGTLSQEYDAVFIIDTSGSMCSYINAVIIALDEYVIQFADNSNFQFAVVIMSNNNGDLVWLEQDFTDLATVQATLASLGCSGSGIEGSLDSMHMVCDIENPLQLSWRDDSNRLEFVFTDEPPQTYTTPTVTDGDVIGECLLSGTLPFTWSFDSRFDTMAQDSNGLGFRLQNQWEPIFDDLNSIVITLCGS